MGVTDSIKHWRLGLLNLESNGMSQGEDGMMICNPLLARKTLEKKNYSLFLSLPLKGNQAQ